jgi:rhomboid family GlyGly-CTERM serine protease
VKLTASNYTCLALSLLIILLTTLSPWVFTSLTFDPEKITHGQLWRLLSGHFVHFGWPHTLMNVAAFMLCSLALLAHYSVTKTLLLIFWCCMAVSAGMYFFNPEYATYAGLSGSIHGFIVAGLLQSKAHPRWLRAIALALLSAKLFQEQSPNYQATDLQALLPVPVAVDAHLYGAISGIAFVVFDCLYQRFSQRK